MSEASNPARHNQNPLPEGNISKYMDRVIDQTLGLEAEQRQAVVGDHLIGAVLRTQGAVDGAATVKSLSENAGRSLTDETGQQREWTASYTRTNGLRRSLLDVITMPDGEPTFNAMGIRMGVSETGRPVMTNMDQITAYLNTPTDAERAVQGTEAAVPWKRVISDEVTKFLQVKGRKEAWDARENLGSDVVSVRQDQETWQHAASLAQRAGVDMQLIAESAQWMHAQQEAGRPVSTAPVIEPTPDFSNLLG